MRVEHLPEPELEFGVGHHLDVRFGIRNYGPLDYASDLAPREIRIGIVGTPDTVEGIRQWLDSASRGVDAKKSHPYLFPDFPGFIEESGFRCKLLFDPRLERAIHEREVIALARANRAELVEAAVGLFLGEITHLVETTNPSVVICALPWSLLDLLAGEEEASAEDVLTAESSKAGEVPDFHHLLKARALSLRKPIQLVKPSTYGVTSRRHPTQLQDDATRAWNFFTAIYYKAGGTPWRLRRDPRELSTCYVGVSFFTSRDRQTTETSIAQVFNERGDGVIVRGSAAAISKEDRQTHLAEDDAHDLLAQALQLYRKEHKTVRARVALLKTSRHDAAEVSGFAHAARSVGVDSIDLVSVGDAAAKLFRRGAYPPLRGTYLALDAIAHVLYTHGSIDFFHTYPGLYVPQPLGIRCEQIDASPRAIASEVLALTKMNWNSTEFGGKVPITVRAARQVGRILKYVEPGEVVEPRYAHYM